MSYPDHTIAIIGLSLRFPGASDPDTFWQNTSTRQSQIKLFTRDELVELGVDPDLVNHKDFVPAMAPIDGLDLFDHHFFDMSPREAEITDPQHRLFLECGYEALEQAGYAKADADRRIGVFGGTGSSSYFMHHLFNKPELRKSVGDYQLNLGNAHDFITTRLSYKLNLSGPSVNVQTGCSTGLTAVHLACEQLLLGDCDIALAGASSLIMPHQYGYVYREGGIAAKDGYCRPFDRSATGTVRGNGVGIVVLKRLQDAIADGDSIDAVIRGSGMNNDGADKVGFTAPSIEGQARAIHDALMLAEVEPGSVDYIETHGTGTPMGDPIEIAALRAAYGNDRQTDCALSSVKSQIGHLDVAAGTAGLIRAVLALKNRTIPPTACFESPNPAIPFDEIPFYVAGQPKEWTPDAPGKPFRAGVSSFGIGGTNLHVILEEYRQHRIEQPSVPNHQLLLFSGKTGGSAADMKEQVVEYAGQHPGSTAAVAATLAHRRPLFSRRTYQVVDPAGIPVSSLIQGPPTDAGHGRKIAFLFSGQGDALAGYGKLLYEDSARFRHQIDEIFALFSSHMELDLHRVLRGELSTGETLVDQPMLFTMQYVMGRWLIEQDVQPDYLLGHSIGELTAAVLAGVWSLEDAVKIVAARAGIMQESPDGAMAAVALSKTEAEAFIRKYDLKVEISSVNAPGLTILGGTPDAINKTKSRCDQDQLFCRKLHSLKAFHTSLFEEAAEQFKAELEAIPFNAPASVVFSNVRGGMAQAENGDLITPDYWARQLRQTVLLSDMFEALPDEDICFVEMGPGRTLLKLGRKSRSPEMHDAHVTTTDIPFDSAEALLADIRGQLWMSGIEQPALQSIPGSTVPVRLPAYPFDRSRFWIPKANYTSGDQLAGISKRNTHSVYTRQWKRLPKPKPADDAPQIILVSESQEVLHQLRGEERDATVHLVHVEDATELRKTLEHEMNGLGGTSNLHLVYVPGDNPENRPESLTEPMLARGAMLSAVIGLAEEIRKEEPVHCTLVTTNAYQVLGSEAVNPGHRWLDGMATGVEWDTGLTSFMRLDIDGFNAASVPPVFDLLRSGPATKNGASSLYAVRNGSVWTETHLEEPLDELSYSFTTDDVWVLFGGNGQIGKAIAEKLQASGLRCAIIGRSVIESSSDTLLQIKTDVADPEETRRALDTVRERWGGIHYIVHLAAQVTPTVVTEFDHDQWHKINQPKIEGLRSIMAADTGTGTHHILFSSLSSVLGGMGHAAYSAANAWMDAVAEQLAETNVTVTSISWDTWRFENDDTGNAPSISMEHGLQNLFAIIASPRRPHWIVSSVPPALRHAQQTTAVHTNGTTGGNGKASPVRHARPSLPVEFRAPADELEEAIATIWSEHLAIEPIGTGDNFFDLGGDSLLLVHLHGDLEALSERPLSKTDLFEHNTIRELAAFMRDGSDGAGDDRKQLRTQKMKQQLFNKR